MTAKKKKRSLVLTGTVMILLALILWTAWENTALELNSYTIESDTLPQSFCGFRMAQVSDLHNAQMGKGNEALLSILKEAEPDMIAITGDLIDSSRTNIEIALQFAKEAVKIAPCYYVTGNHEAMTFRYDALRTGLIELGVVVLQDERVKIERSGETITLLGVDDPIFQGDRLPGDAASVMERKLQTLKSDEDAYTILLSHRPELFEVYTESGVNLVLSGHAHGGQFRLPFFGGLIAPNQGLFPKYDSGRYTEGNTTMVVSRGIGNSIIPFRFHNPPEVILIELSNKS